MFQVIIMANAEKRLRFTSAVFHHLSAIKIQRALRAHWALESAKKQIHSVITIQVRRHNAIFFCQNQEVEQRVLIGFLASYSLYLIAMGESEAAETTVSGRQEEGGCGPESRATLVRSPPQGCVGHSASRAQIPPFEAPEESAARHYQSSGTTIL